MRVSIDGARWCRGRPKEIKSGMVLLLDDGGNKFLLLVGDINERGGVCDCNSLLQSSCDPQKPAKIIKWMQIDIESEGKLINQECKE